MDANSDGAMHPATLVIADLPKQVLVGIDLFALTASSKFAGFTLLSPGWHFLFVGTDQTLSSRQGLWWHIPEQQDPREAQYTGQKRQRSDSQLYGIRGEIITPKTEAQPTPELASWLGVLRWNPDTEELIPDGTDFENWRQRLLVDTSLQKALFPCRVSAPPADSDGTELVKRDEKKTHGGPPQDIPLLTRHISERVLNRICGTPEQDSPSFWSLHTTSSTNADAEAERIPGLATDEKSSDKTLDLLDIDLKTTWPAGATGRARTDAARDRSWRLEDVVSRCSQVENAKEDDSPPSPWGGSLLGEFEFCFLMVLCLSNWSCLSQWQRILELCLTCSQAIAEHPGFFDSFLRALQLQLCHVKLADGGLFDFEADGGDLLGKLLRRFDNNLTDQEQMVSSEDKERRDSLQAVRSSLHRVKDTIRDVLGWELDNDVLKKGLLQLEDGEYIELETAENDYDDETGEYAPVLVSTDI